MKRLLFGCTLMLCGILGGSAWLLARTSLAAPGAWSSAANMLPGIGYGGFDGVMVLLFYVIAVIGLVQAIRGLKSDK